MGKYDDIIHLPHHVSEKRAQMPMRERAAQFAPFAALTGYEAAIDETARLTEHRSEPDEAVQARLDARLRLLRDRLDERPEVAVTRFIPDARKAGGAYIVTAGAVYRISGYERLLVMEDGTRIPFDEICDVTGELFSALEQGE